VSALPGGGLAQAPKESTTVTVDGDELADVRAQLTAILVQGATLTQTVTGLREAVDRQTSGHADHEVRLRALEASRARLAGAYAAVTFLGGAGGVALTYVVQALQDHH
jgi:hypothetical protein